MFPIDTLFCPCCTPVLLRTIAQWSSHLFSKQTLILGTGALVVAIVQEHRALRRSSAAMPNGWG